MLVTPLVSVIMPIYNSQRTIVRSLDSIINQTYQNLEIIIIDDGSNDNSVEIIEKYKINDERIRLFQNDKNMGLAWSLNKAIVNSNGYYIARMDADDKSHYERIEKQVYFLENNSEVDVLGTGSRYVDEHYKFVKNIKMPKYHKDCVRMLPKTTPFIHPTVVIRRDFFDRVGFYNQNLRKAQDYELWVRAANFSHYANLEDLLLDYTIPKNKSYTTMFQEIKVRTTVAYKYNFLLSSLRYTLIGLVLAVGTRL